MSLTDVDRATVLAQIAGLLVDHPKIGRTIAFKGGAIANLVNRSPRLSKDLDSHIAQARKRIRPEWVHEALTGTAQVRRVVSA